MDISSTELEILLYRFNEQGDRLSALEKEVRGLRDDLRASRKRSDRAKEAAGKRKPKPPEERVFRALPVGPPGINRTALTRRVRLFADKLSEVLLRLRAAGVLGEEVQHGQGRPAHMLWRTVAALPAGVIPTLADPEDLTGPVEIHVPREEIEQVSEDTPGAWFDCEFGIWRAD